MAIEIVDFPIDSMVIFHGKMLVHQRVPSGKHPQFANLKFWPSRTRMDQVNGDLWDREAMAMGYDRSMKMSGGSGSQKWIHMHICIYIHMFTSFIYLFYFILFVYIIVDLFMYPYICNGWFHLSPLSSHPTSPSCQFSDESAKAIFSEHAGVKKAWLQKPRAQATSGCCG